MRSGTRSSCSCHSVDNGPLLLRGMPLRFRLPYACPIRGQLPRRSPRPQLEGGEEFVGDVGVDEVYVSIDLDIVDVLLGDDDPAAAQTLAVIVVVIVGDFVLDLHVHRVVVAEVLEEPLRDPRLRGIGAQLEQRLVLEVGKLPVQVLPRSLIVVKLLFRGADHKKVNHP